MPLWIAIGADSVTGQFTIDCLCGADYDQVSRKANDLGHFVSEIFLVDTKPSRLGKYSVGTCANWLKDNSHADYALRLLDQNSFIPNKFTFDQARWLVPYFLAANKTDLAWDAIQEAKSCEFENSMYCAEAEKLHLIEMEYLTLKRSNQYPAASYYEAAYRLARSFLPSPPDKEDFIEVHAVVAAEFAGLDDTKLKIAATVIFAEYIENGSLSAILISSDTIRGCFE